MGPIALACTRRGLAALAALACAQTGRRAAHAYIWRLAAEPRAERHKCHHARGRAPMRARPRVRRFHAMRTPLSSALRRLSNGAVELEERFSCGGVPLRSPELAGSGGSGVVFSALDGRGGGGRLAVKVAWPGAAADAVRHEAAVRAPPSSPQPSSTRCATTQPFSAVHPFPAIQLTPGASCVGARGRPFGRSPRRALRGRRKASAGARALHRGGGGRPQPASGRAGRGCIVV
jgi:hypothetical protein